MSFDLYLLRSWDGNDTTSGNTAVGPDLWKFGVSSNTLLITTFSNWSTGHQAYPLTYPNSNQPAFTAATEIKTLGYEFFNAPMNSVYHLTFLIPHQTDVLVLDFSALGLQELSDESWGLDNVEVMIIDLIEKEFLPIIIR